jgi:ABC-2 type transport system ATP-binding protein
VSSGPPSSAQPDEISFGRGRRAPAELADNGQYAKPRVPLVIPSGQGSATPKTPEPATPEPATPEPATPEPGTAAIATVGLTKRFRGGQLAVDDLSLEVPHGSVYGFLGPNGSGKTTTIRMLLGLVQPTSGTHQLLGVTMAAGANAVLPRVGSLVEGPAFYSFLSGRANLARCDAADRTADPGTAAARIGEALERVGLTAAAAKHYRAYSLGMKQRLAIAAGLLSRRDLMILDEPTNGLDPQGTREVRSLIREIAADGTTVFVSSHLLAEVEQISSHVGVMRAGRLVFEGTLDQLRGTGAARITVTTPDAAVAAGVLTGLGLADIQALDGHVSAELGEQAPEDINARLVHANVRVAGLAATRPSLEDQFVELTGEGFDVNG